MSATQETKTRTLEDVSFETFSLAKRAMQAQHERVDIGQQERDQYEAAVAELVEKWNDATERERERGEE